MWSILKYIINYDYWKVKNISICFKVNIFPNSIERQVFVLRNKGNKQKTNRVNKIIPIYLIRYESTVCNIIYLIKYCTVVTKESKWLSLHRITKILYKFKILFRE